MRQLLLLTYLSLATLFSGCEYDISLIFKTIGKPSPESMAHEMLLQQYAKGGAETILKIDNYKELSRSKVPGGYTYSVRYDLVFKVDAMELLETLNERSAHGAKHDEDVNKLIHQFGHFKKGTKSQIHEQITVVRGKHGLELQRY